MLIASLLSYVNDCEKPSKKCKCSPHLRLRDKSNTMRGRLMAFHWRQVIWSWLKLMPKGEEESEGPVGGGTIGSGISSC